jgi:hypothetical protein
LSNILANMMGNVNGIELSTFFKVKSADYEKKF